MYFSSTLPPSQIKKVKSSLNIIRNNLNRKNKNGYVRAIREMMVMANEEVEELKHILDESIDSDQKPNIKPKQNKKKPVKIEMQKSPIRTRSMTKKKMKQQQA